MKTMKKLVLGLIFTITLIMSISTVAFGAEVASGNCNSSIVWSLADDGVLTVSGQGAMPNWPIENYVPWNSHVADIKSVVINEGITTVGDYAFYNCTSLSNVSLPSTLKSIGSHTFTLTSIAELVVPEKVTYIGDTAFENADCLSKVTLPEGLLRIDDAAFYQCYVLTDIKIPSTVKVIGAAVFSGCTSLESIEIPEGIEVIDQLLFKDCENLKSVIIPSSVKEIKYKAFDGCEKLIGITLPENLIKIGEQAFYGCTALSVIKIPDKTEIIGGSAFNGCTSLAAISLPDSLKYVEENAFSRTAWYENNKDGFMIIDNWLIDYTGDVASNGDLAIPNNIIGLADYALSEISKIKTIDIPSGLKIIGDMAFYECDDLEDFVIPGTVERIGSSAFADTKWYNNNADGVVYCGNWLLDYKGYSYEEFVLEMYEGVTKIADEALSFAPVSKVKLHDNVTDIGKAAFRGCGSLEEIEIPRLVTKLEESTFQDCSALTTLTLPDTMTYIGDKVFTGCYKLTNVVLPKNLEHLGDNALAVSGITDIEIPAGVTRIGAYTFNGCAGLTKVTIPENVKYIADYAFDSCGELEDVEILGGVEYIGKGAFGKYTNLVNITMSDSVKMIDAYALSTPYIYYNGTESEWDSIYVEHGNNFEEDENNIPTQVFCIDGNPAINKALSGSYNVDGDTFEYNIEFENMNCDCTLIVVIFNRDGKITGFDSAAVNSGDTSKNIIVDSPDASYSKVYVWSNLESVVPICDSIKFDSMS